MAKKQELKTKAVETPMRLPDFQTQISKGNLCIRLSETDSKLEVQFAGVDTIHTEADLRTFQSMLDDVMYNFVSSRMTNFEECDETSDCECDNGPCYCRES